jgi:hypothetical protein
VIAEFDEKVTSRNWEVRAKTYVPMLVTVDGMFIDCKRLSTKEFAANVVTVSGITYEASVSQGAYASKVVLFLLNSTPF